MRETFYPFFHSKWMVFSSRYGTIIDVDLAREAPATSATPSPHAVNAGKSRGFAFVGYEDQRSTILAVDNFNGIKVCLSLEDYLFQDFGKNNQGGPLCQLQGYQKDQETGGG